MGFLVLAIWLATKNDALCADIFDKVGDFNNCICSSCLCFLLKNSKGLSFMQGAWSPCGKAPFFLDFFVQMINIIQVVLGECKSPVVI